MVSTKKSRGEEGQNGAEPEYQEWRASDRVHRQAAERVGRAEPDLRVLRTDRFLRPAARCDQESEVLEQPGREFRRDADVPGDGAGRREPLRPCAKGLSR